MKRSAAQSLMLGGAILLGAASMAAAYEEAPVVNGGTVTGVVRFSGTVPPPKRFELWRAPDRTYCGALSDGSGARLLQEVAVSQEGRLKDVVMTIEDIQKGKPFTLNETKLDAVVCQFLPFVTVVRNAHPMTVTNIDPVSHDLQVYERDREHVFSMFHRPSLTNTGTTDQIRFTQGRRQMVMQCGMHPYMQAHGLAVENPYYAISGLDGRFTIPEVPPGTYRLRAWHSLLAPQEQTIVIQPGKTVEITVSFTGSSAEPAPTSRVEVVLAGQYRNDAAAIKREFAQAGLPNVHLQFLRQGQPPPNLGLGPKVPAERARAAIRLALKYNQAVTILLPAHVLPPTFITIASSNFDDTVEFPITEDDLRRLQDPSLTTEQFHALYRRLTTPRRSGGK